MLKRKSRATNFATIKEGKTRKRTIDRNSGRRFGDQTSAVVFIPEGRTKSDLYFSVLLEKNVHSFVVLLSTVFTWGQFLISPSPFLLTPQ